MDNSKSEYLVIMGAAVKPDGTPSGAMRRRIDGALQLASMAHNPTFLATGGVGKHGHCEAVAMKNVLAGANIPEDHIILERESKSTLTSIIRCSRILKNRQNVKSVTVCTDRYHIPRCRWIFLMLGVATTFGAMPSGYKVNGLLRWSYYYLREMAAFPVNTILLLMKNIYNKITGKHFIHER